MLNKRSVSIIVVNFNGFKWLKGCFDALIDQSYRDLEIIFVDNASTDNSVDFIKTNYPSVKTVKNDENYGFAKGNNIGYKHSKGDYIILLNNDTYVEKDYVTNFINVFDKYPRCGIAQSKIVLMDNPKKLDCAGSFWTDTTFLYHYGFGKDASDPKYNKDYKVFSVKGASMIIKREVIDTIGLFDDDFWCYYEETDLCHRAWLTGYEVWYYPEALCYHAMGATSSKFKNEFVQYHNLKNKLSSFTKNFDFYELFKIYFLFSIFNLFYGLLSLIKNRRLNYLKSLIEAFFCCHCLIKGYSFTSYLGKTLS